MVRSHMRIKRGHATCWVLHSECDCRLLHLGSSGRCIPRTWSRSHQRPLERNTRIIADSQQGPLSTEPASPRLATQRNATHLPCRGVSTPFPLLPILLRRRSISPGASQSRPRRSCRPHVRTRTGPPYPSSPSSSYALPLHLHLLYRRSRKERVSGRIGGRTRWRWRALCGMMDRRVWRMKKDRMMEGR